MAMNEAPKSLGERLQSVPKFVLYIALILVTSLPLFVNIKVPNEPGEASIAFYGELMKIPKGAKVLIGSDWTNSTRGESSGEFECLLKILMRRGIKFAVYSTADAQAPQVARDSIRRVIPLVAKEGYPAYKPFEDYVVLGYFPNSEGTTNAINNNIRGAFSGKKDSPEGSGPRDVFESPVLKDVNSVADFKYLVLVTASSTNTITVERINKVPLMYMVSGVMIPENQTLFASGQIKGMIGGVKGVYDLETMMEKGIAPIEKANDKTVFTSPKYPEGIESFAGKPNEGKGTAYFLALHFAIILLIIAVVVGNLGMFLSKKRSS